VTHGRTTVKIRAPPISIGGGVIKKLIVLDIIYIFIRTSAEEQKKHSRQTDKRTDIEKLIWNIEKPYN